MDRDRGEREQGGGFEKARLALYPARLLDLVPHAFPQSSEIFYERTCPVPIGSPESCRYCCKTIFRIRARNDDSRLVADTQCWFKDLCASITSLLASRPWQSFATQSATCGLMHRSKEHSIRSALTIVIASRMRGQRR
jgi:hypothetical protein